MATPQIIKQAAQFLRSNMTDAEKILWEEMRSDRLNGKRCVRQKPIYIMQENSGLKRYIIADFAFLREKLIIELDGSIHDIPEVLELDIEKEKLLQNLGYTVLRFKNEDIFQNMEAVLEKILNKLQPSVFRMKEGDSEEDYGKSKDSGKSLKSGFIMRNESFTCENCGKEISKHPSGSARNHCPACLYSKHLDKDFPGDRASECHGIMKPIGKDYKKNKGWMVIHECQKCTKKIPNKLAEDDNLELFGKL